MHGKMQLCSVQESTYLNGTSRKEFQITAMVFLKLLSYFMNRSQ